jgi:tRNA threonylcarbamoyladenosine biosynthesis protein TsaB
VVILALDTTTRAGSVAVLADGALLAEHTGDPASTHAQRLPADLMRALETARVPLSAVDRFAVAAGPGSFTGLRIGIATMQGLAMAGKKPIVPVSTLEALAESVTDLRVQRVAAWMDAQRGEVFAALYARDGDDWRNELAATSATAEATLVDWSAVTPLGGVRFVGDGAVRYRDAIAARLPQHAPVTAEVPALAPAIARIAFRHPERAVAPYAVMPIYVRKPDAELARDRRREGVLRQDG